uniref:Cytochrome P450 n=1 Tax=Cannabis sativa TaxID=3483 RepID=A0A803PF52_CANSA
MDPFLQIVVSCLLPLLLIFICYHLKKSSSSTNSGPILAPEAAGAWPIIGHLHLFGGKNLTHKTLGAMADKDGPIFTIKLGSHKVVVVNNGEIAKDCLTTHDMAFSTRPTIVASKLLGYNYAMFGFAPYGDYWREMRKIATVELLSNQRLDLLKHIWSSEVDTWASELYNKLCLEKGSEKNRVLVDMKRWFGDLTEKDFMDVMLNILDGANVDGVDADTINKATCLNLMLAGSDTTMIALTWALSLLLNNPNKLQKAQLELDQIVGRERNVEESDIQNLIYLQAIIKETIRLYPPSPLLLRATKEDCTLTCGYHVRKGTRLMVNTWKIQREERVWGHNSEEFEPERFLTSHKEVDLRGKLGFEMVSFGGGRRSCHREKKAESFTMMGEEGLRTGRRWGWEVTVGVVGEGRRGWGFRG